MNRVFKMLLGIRSKLRAPNQRRDGCSCAGDAHHSLVALTLAEGGLVEAIPPLLHGVGGDLAQRVYNILLPMPCLRILQGNTSIHCKSGQARPGLMLHPLVRVLLPLVMLCTC